MTEHITVQMSFLRHSDSGALYIATAELWKGDNNEVLTTKPTTKPSFEIARLLLTAGCEPDRMMVVFRKGEAHFAMQGPVGVFAKTKVTERKKGSAFAKESK